MTSLTRRRFGAAAGASILALAAPARGLGASRARVVVVGGGIGGATGARYLATQGIDVTLVESKRSYTTCFFSDLYLAGLRSMASITHGYEALSQTVNLRVVHQRAAGIDPGAKTVSLADGTTLPYDRLLLAPGISFKYGGIEGYDEAATHTMPHAWQGGAQTGLLRRQIESMEDGGTFIIAVPPDPFRCPPAPYERASLVAAYFKVLKPRSKILILDAKDSFKAQDLFEDAWARHYPGMIEWLPKQFTGGVTAVDLKGGVVMTADQRFPAAVANIVPAQMAGELARSAGLADASGWCPVDPETFESTLAADIHVVGDSIIGGEMPKSAFSANSQAKVCAFAIAAALKGEPTPPGHLYNSCYTFLAADDAFTNAISFKPVDGKIKTTEAFINKVDESAEKRRRTAEEAIAWYAAFTRDVFGGAAAAQGGAG